MKGLIIALTSFTVLFLGGWNAAGERVESPTESPIERHQEPARAGQLEAIAGTWHGFPAGLLLHFDDDGSARFGLDWDGTAVGYGAVIWFEGQELSIRFTDYDGQDEACGSATGRYSVQLHQDGSIGFVAVHDGCAFRMAALSGVAGGDSGLMFHPVAMPSMAP